MTSISSVLLFLSCLLLSSHCLKAQTLPPAVSGLSYSFYARSCPTVESIVREELRRVFAANISQAAGIIRVHFHDCFVQGCDGSVLLDGSASTPSEQDAPPNLTLREASLQIINDLRRRVHSRCGPIVSCADILTLASRDSVFLSGGPDFRVPLGRRDSLTFATRADTLANLPGPTRNASFLISAFATKNLNPTDLVALSGAHTFGLSHCGAFRGRIYPTRDPTMDQTFFNNLRTSCPTNTSNNIVNMDIRSPDVFDNRYYVNLMNRQGLFTSDQDLHTDSRTRGIVINFAINQTLFFENFVVAMIRMSQLSPLTGTQGEIRNNCAVRNSATSFLSSVVEQMEEKLLSF